MVPLFDPHFTTSRPKSLKFSGTLLAANTSSPRDVGCLDLTYGATEEFMEQLLTSKDPYISPYVKSYIAEILHQKIPNLRSVSLKDWIWSTWRSSWNRAFFSYSSLIRNQLDVGRLTAVQVLWMCCWKFIPWNFVIWPRKNPKWPWKNREIREIHSESFCRKKTKNLGKCNDRIWVYEKNLWIPTLRLSWNSASAGYMFGYLEVSSSHLVTIRVVVCY